MFTMVSEADLRKRDEVVEMTGLDEHQASLVVKCCAEHQMTIQQFIKLAAETALIEWAKEGK
jgi:hypothetical protein